MARAERPLSQAAERSPTGNGGSAIIGARGGATASSGGSSSVGPRGGATASGGNPAKGGSSAGGSGTISPAEHVPPADNRRAARAARAAQAARAVQAGLNPVGPRTRADVAVRVALQRAGVRVVGSRAVERVPLGGQETWPPQVEHYSARSPRLNPKPSSRRSRRRWVGKFAVHLGYYDWSLDYTSFARADITAGRIPYVTVEPFNTSLDSIASGSEDTLIRSRATAVKSLGGKLLLRFAHEMNGNWYPWDGYHNGANSAAPQKYVAAYRHLHDVFASAGVTNVLWVFCPNVDSVPNESWNQWSNYYPGDSYVDWMCFDGYNWGTDTFASMTSRIYPGLAAKGKPIMLGETSTKDVEKSNWISAILPAMKSQFPLLKALVWFDVNKENDWRFDSTSNSLSAFVTMAKNPYLNPK
ncbi:MAG: glycosyl hydrolase [Polyangiaceae bacterium]